MESLLRSYQGYLLFLKNKNEGNLDNITTIPYLIFCLLMFSPFDIVYILFETFFVYVKMRELFEVAELDGTLCMLS
jgi:hypothetical protein